MKYSDEPSSNNFPGKPADNPKQVIYKEGIYVGYRYFNTFHVKPAYAFGYGLSYTTFKFDNLKLSSSHFNGSVTATVDVTNSDKVAGKEAVQLYISAPDKELKKPSEELRAFAKTHLLRPGETQTISFTIKPGDLSSYDTAKSEWIDEAGEYTVKIGAASNDIRQTATFTLPKDLVVEKDTRVLTPPQAIHGLR
jgi:beta-glucosidase